MLMLEGEDVYILLRACMCDKRQGCIVCGGVSYYESSILLREFFEVFDASADQACDPYGFLEILRIHLSADGACAPGMG